MTSPSLRDPRAEERRVLPWRWSPGWRLPLDHTFTTDETYDFYQRPECIVCGRVAGDHYRKTMLDDIYQLGWRQAPTSPHEVYPPMPLFLERPVRVA